MNRPTDSSAEEPVDDPSTPDHPIDEHPSRSSGNTERTAETEAEGGPERIVDDEGEFEG